MSYVTDNIFDVDSHQTVDREVALELDRQEVDGSTKELERNQTIMALMLELAKNKLDHDTVYRLTFTRDRDFFTTLKEIWLSGSFHKIGSLSEHLILDQTIPATHVPNDRNALVGRIQGQQSMSLYA